MWLPFGVVAGRWPPAEWSSALVALVAGYIAGHLLQGLTINVFPSRRQDRNRAVRYPSDILLDDPDTLAEEDKDKRLSPEVTGRVARRILAEFGINVVGGNVRDGENLDRQEIEKRRQDLQKRRQDAFFLCRRALIQTGVGSYAEQFEGMYTLMRGITAAGVLSTTYHLGWALARFLPVSVKDWLTYLTVIGLVLLLYQYKSPRAFWLVSAILLAVGCLFGWILVISLEEFFLLSVICFTSLFVSLRCYDAYVAFSWHFAATVYRDFCILKSTKE